MAWLLRVDSPDAGVRRPEQVTASGPIPKGSLIDVLIQHTGFRATFYVFAALASIGAAVFARFVPEMNTGAARKDGEPKADPQAELA